MKYFKNATLIAACTFIISSCSDWTDPKPVDVTFGTIEESENYPSYLESLREYRTSPHTRIYAWINLSEEIPVNQSERVTSLPDSIDVLVLSSITALHPTVAGDLQKVRDDKGMKVIFEVDYDAIKLQHSELCAQNAVERQMLIYEYENRPDADNAAVKSELEEKLTAFEDPLLSEYVVSSISEKLNYAEKMNLDGVIFAFDGKTPNYLSDEERAEYMEQKALFFGAVKDWRILNPQKIFAYLGKPENLTDEELISDFQFFFIRRGLDASSVSSFTLLKTIVEGANIIPSEKIAMMTTFASPDANDVTTGIFSDGSYALDGLTNWITGNDLGAVGIKNVQFDYFSSSFSYPHVRKLIQSVNPNF